MKVLLVGGGGREHALAWKLSQSDKLDHLYIAPGNPGTADYGTNVDIADTDVAGLAAFAQAKKIDLAVVGPEDPLAAGAVDAFEAVGIRAFGPSGPAAQLEADKAFSKHIMRANSIPTAESRTFTSFEDAKAYIASRDEAVVVKAAKQGHDMRFDIPVIGTKTVGALRRAGVSALSFQAGRIVMLDPDEVIAAADRLGIAITGIDSGLPSAPLRP